MNIAVGSVVVQTYRRWWSCLSGMRLTIQGDVSIDPRTGALSRIVLADLSVNIH